MPQTDERYRRELRRFRLALRMIAQSARTQTIRKWTGWSVPRIQNASRSYLARDGVRQGMRPSGPSPTDLKFFWRSHRMRREAGALAGLFTLAGVLPPAGTAVDSRRLPTLRRGEQLCEAYENFRVFIPKPKISFEHALLLATTLACGDEIVMSRCGRCASLLLVERVNPQFDCTYCRDGEASG